MIYSYRSKKCVRIKIAIISTHKFEANKRLISLIWYQNYLS